MTLLNGTSFHLRVLILFFTSLYACRSVVDDHVVGFPSDANKYQQSLQSGETFSCFSSDEHRIESSAKGFCHSYNFQLPFESKSAGKQLVVRGAEKQKMDMSFKLKSSSSVYVHPPVLDWGERSLYSCSIKSVRVLNTCKESITVYESYSSNPQFSPTNNSVVLLKPGQEALFCFMFMPRLLGSSSGKLMLQTSFGGFLINLKGSAVYGSYKLVPFLMFPSSRLSDYLDNRRSICHESESKLQIFLNSGVGELLVFGGNKKVYPSGGITSSANWDLTSFKFDLDWNLNGNLIRSVPFLSEFSLLHDVSNPVSAQKMRVLKSNIFQITFVNGFLELDEASNTNKNFKLMEDSPDRYQFPEKIKGLENFNSLDGLEKTSPCLKGARTSECVKSGDFYVKLKRVNFSLPDLAFNRGGTDFTPLASSKEFIGKLVGYMIVIELISGLDYQSGYLIIDLLEGLIFQNGESKIVFLPCQIDVPIQTIHFWRSDIWERMRKFSVVVLLAALIFLTIIHTDNVLSELFVVDLSISGKNLEEDQCLKLEEEQSDVRTEVQTCNLSVRTGKDRVKRRKKKRNPNPHSILNLVDVSSSQSGNSTPTSPLSPATYEFKESLQESKISDHQNGVAGCNMAKKQDFRSGSGGIPSSRLPPHARAPGWEICKRKEAKVEKGEDKYRYDIWGDLFSGIDISSSSKDFAAIKTLALQNDFSGFFVKGPYSILTDATVK